MCATKKQIASNRKNAQKATGPKTAEGKKTVSQNAVKHGIFARDTVIKSPHLNENREDFDYLVQSLNTEFRPVGVFQEYLVNIMADCIWRRRRAVNAETARIQERLGNLNDRVRYVSVFDYFPGKNRDNFDPDNDTEIRTFIKKILSHLDMIPTSDYGDRIVGYQTLLDIQLLRAYRMLMRLKKPGALGYTLAPDKKSTKKDHDTY